MNVIPGQHLRERLNDEPLHGGHSDHSDELGGDDRCDSASGPLQVDGEIVDRSRGHVWCFDVQRECADVEAASRTLCKLRQGVWANFG
jgi:hypothetical protein